MTNSLFITGSSGSIGSRLLEKLDHNHFDHIYCLSRKKDCLPNSIKGNGKFHSIRAGIYDSENYKSSLANCKTVIHLAAATGKAPQEEYFDINAKGVDFFVEKCKRVGVINFLHVSTIAVKYKAKSQYHYARSKEIGERVIQNSGLNYTIVRPTVVIGENSGSWESLKRLATTPIVPLFGNGKSQIQPIYIDDLIDCLLSIIEGGTFLNETYELGGPEQITYDSFLRKIHQAYYGKEPRVIRVPIKFLMRIISLFEKWFYSVLPLTSGQLSVFANDSVIDANGLFNKHAPGMKSINDMLGLIVGRHKEELRSTLLDRECHALMNYLLHMEPTTYVMSKYRQAHSRSADLRGYPLNRFDGFLMALAVRSPVMAKLVDTYTAIFFKASTFRKKAILMMAILENATPTYIYFEEQDASTILTVVLKLLQKGIVFLFTLLLSILLLVPIKTLFSLTSKSSPEAKTLWTES